MIFKILCLVLATTLVSAVDKYDFDFVRCCGNKGVPGDVSRKLCKYRHDDSEDYECDLLKNPAYFNVMIYCATAGRGFSGCTEKYTYVEDDCEAYYGRPQSTPMGINEALDPKYSYCLKYARNIKQCAREIYKDIRDQPSVKDASVAELSYEQKQKFYDDYIALSKSNSRAHREAYIQSSKDLGCPL